MVHACYVRWLLNFFLALCTHASNIGNGQVTSTGNSVGDTATYTCNTGFELIGQAVATCTQATDGNSATFTPTAPVCQGKIVCLWPFRMYIK